MKEEVLKILEATKQNCPHDSHSHCMEEQCAIWEADGWNAALDFAIERVKIEL